MAVQHLHEEQRSHAKVYGKSDERRKGLRDGCSARGSSIPVQKMAEQADAPDDMYRDVGGIIRAMRLAMDA